MALLTTEAEQSRVKEQHANDQLSPTWIDLVVEGASVASQSPTVGNGTHMHEH